MWKMFKSRKALSPVVAAIILIAVTVAVSIAVAAWMGALTFTFMKTEELKVLGSTWGANRAYIDLSVKNTGSSALTVNQIRINDISNGTLTTAVPLTGGASATLHVVPTTYTGIVTFTAGTKYEFQILTAAGNKYTYVATAP
jgi:flagellin-like protein